MNIKTVNGENFIPASVISKGNVYRFDLSPASVVATAIKYDYSIGWIFDVEGENVTYSVEELRTRINAGTIWKKLSASTTPNQ